jgi:hypothetical protein
MNEMDLDKYFKDRLTSREVPLDEGSWNALSDQLDKVAPQRPGFLTWAAIAAGIAMIASLGWIATNVSNYGGLSQPEYVQREPASSETNKMNEAGMEIEEIYSEGALFSNQSNELQDEVFYKGSLADLGQKKDVLATGTLEPQNDAPAGQGDIDADNSTAFGQQQSTLIASAQTKEEAAVPDFVDKLFIRSRSSGLLPVTPNDQIASKNGMSRYNPVGNNGIKLRRQKLGLIAGLNIGNELNAENNNQFSGNEFIGLSYEYMLNGGWSIGTELIYQRRSGVKADQHHMARTYHFSSTMEYVRIDAKKLHYLELPVLARYTMKQHIVHAGVGFVYLVDCESEVTHSKWDYENSQTEVTVENGHVSGFNRWDIALMAGYEYEPLQWISIGGRVSYGFIDVTKPGHFSNDYYSNNLQFRIFARITPFRF